MIAIDYSGVAIAAITGFQEDLSRDEAAVENLVRHVILSTIKNYKKTLSKEFGNEVVIACDSSPYWRSKIFAHYKYKRKKNKEESDIPWELIHKNMDAVLEDLRNHFPYKVIKVPGAEADDVIGVLVQDIATRPKEGLLDDDAPTKCVVVSRDKDMGQCLTHPNIKQFNPFTKKFVKLDTTAKMYLRRLILTGDAGDGVPNVFSPIDSFYTGTRQKPATEKKMAPLLEATNMLDAAVDDVMRQRIIENTRLISFASIPKALRESIAEAYDVKPVGNKMSVLKYLASKGMKQMMGDIDEF